MAWPAANHLVVSFFLRNDRCSLLKKGSAPEGLAPFGHGAGFAAKEQDTPDPDFQGAFSTDSTDGLAGRN